MKKKPVGSVRIIGGKWRGTRLPVADLPGLRPSGDRSRETLFNWLQMQIRGAHCADLFAGSGVLGLEAASRGAAAVTLVEKAREAARQIRESLERLGAEQVELFETDAIGWLSACAPQSLDLVFVDPPFGSGLEQSALELLTAGDCVRSGGLVYVETAKTEELITPGPGWEISREKRLGDVQMLLLKKT
jgi:16S rRNA (guanine966-N2)-methyltransferase